MYRFGWAFMVFEWVTAQMFCLIQKMGKRKESKPSFLSFTVLCWCDLSGNLEIILCVRMCVCLKETVQPFLREELRASATAFVILSIFQVPISIWLHCHTCGLFFIFNNFRWSVLWRPPWKTFRLFQNPQLARPWLPCRSHLCVAHCSPEESGEVPWKHEESMHVWIAQCGLLKITGEEGPAGHSISSRRDPG